MSFCVVVIFSVIIVIVSLLRGCFFSHVNIYLVRSHAIFILFVVRFGFKASLHLYFLNIYRNTMLTMAMVCLFGCFYQQCFLFSTSYREMYHWHMKPTKIPLWRRKKVSVVHQFCVEMLNSFKFLFKKHWWCWYRQRRTKH